MSIEKIRNIGLDKLVTQVYDFDSLTTDELMCKFAQKINIIIEHFKYLDDRCYNSDKAMELKLEYLLGQGLEKEVSKKIIKLVDDGTISEIIVNDIFNDLSSQIQEVRTELDNNVGQLNNNVEQLNNNVGQLNNKHELILDDISNMNLEISNKYDNVVLNDDTLLFYSDNVLKNSIKLNLNRNSKIYDKIKSSKKCYKIGHRGLSGAYPENTLLAIKKAGEYNCDMVEFDVNYTSDNKFILMHDDTVDRTTNGVGNTNTFTLAQIKELNIDGGKNSDIFTTLKVPTLEEALLQCKASNLVPFIEIKSQVPISLSNSIINIIENLDMVESVVLTSFNHEILFQIQEINNKITIAPITDLTLVNVNKFKDRENTLLSVPYPSNFSMDALKVANSEGLPVMAWTVNDKDTIDFLQSNNIDGIISDVYNGKKDRKFLMLNGSDPTVFVANYEFNSDVVKVTKKDAQTLLLTWDIPFFGNERPLAFANEDSGDKIGFVPMTRGTKNNTVEVKFRKAGESSIINLTDINTYNVYFSVIVLGN